MLSNVTEELQLFESYNCLSDEGTSTDQMLVLRFNSFKLVGPDAKKINFFYADFGGIGGAREDLDDSFFREMSIIEKRLWG